MIQLVWSKVHVCGELKFQEKVWILSFLCYGICMSIMRIENRREPRDFDVCMETACVCVKAMLAVGYMGVEVG